MFMPLYFKIVARTRKTDLAAVQPIGCHQGAADPPPLGSSRCQRFFPQRKERQIKKDIDPFGGASLHPDQIGMHAKNASFFPVAMPRQCIVAGVPCKRDKNGDFL
jgi:hypothetical protein